MAMRSKTAMSARSRSTFAGRPETCSVASIWSVARSHDGAESTTASMTFSKPVSNNRSNSVMRRPGGKKFCSILRAVCSS